MKQSVLIVEDLAPMREWLIEVAAELLPEDTRVSCPDVGTAVRHLATLKPESPRTRLALVDLGLPDGSGIEVLRMLRARQPECMSVVVTLYDDDAHLFEALGAGAEGYLLKSDPRDSFRRTLARMLAGEPPISPAIARKLMSHFRQPEPTAHAVQLTPRETDVLACMGRGLRIKDAARELGISEHTVGDYVKAIYRKLNISTRAEAAIEASRRGLLPPN